jgi:protein TIF31
LLKPNTIELINKNAQSSEILLKNENLDSVIQNDSGHESSGSLSTELPSTPEGEQRQHNEFTNTNVEKLNWHDSAETKYFRIKISVPSGESIDVQICDTDIVQELYQMLLERDTTCHRTCFRLYYKGNPLDQFTEIRNIPNIEDQSVFSVIEEPYNIREARTHVRHLREIIRSHDISDAVNGVEFASFSCLTQITQSVDESRKASRPLLSSNTSEIRPEADFMPPYWLLPGSGDVPLKPLLQLNVGYHKNGSESLIPNTFHALRQIYFSSFNPPPGPRKMKGDVLYLVVDCIEERRFHITCCTRGFFVNSSVGDVFKPEKSSIYGNRIHHSLFDLLSDLSPHFKKTFAQILKARSDKHVFERLPTPYQHYQWIVPLVDNKLDQMRAEDQIQPFRIGFEDHMPGQVRDWNEELQTTHDMPQTTFAERLCRDRARFKVNADFLQSCVRGAMAVIDGSVLSINPSDEPKMQMFIWNNIFLSLGFDVKDHYKEIGGDFAAHASYSADLNAVQAYAHIDDQKLHTCGMAIIDLRGCRIMAQSIIPGILDREQHEPIVYGSFDSGKTVLSNDFYAKLLENSAEILKIQPHLVWNGKHEDEYVKLFSSYESKGIIGNDRRHYLMDLLRTFPPDVNFLENAQPTEKSKALGFPRKFPHQLVYLRQELVDTFVDVKIFEKRKSMEGDLDWNLDKNDKGNNKEGTNDDSNKEMSSSNLHKEIDEAKPLSIC